MIQGGRRLRFAEQSPACLRVVNGFCRQGFDRDLAFELRVFSKEHFAHPARAEFLNDAIVSDLRSQVTWRHQAVEGGGDSPSRLSVLVGLNGYFRPTTDRFYSQATSLSMNDFTAFV
jgi:hypothetical protein